MIRSALIAALLATCAVGPAMAFNGNNIQLVPLIEKVDISVDRFVSNETLPLRQLGNIGQQYAGRTLHAVKVEFHQFGPAGRVELLVNGQVVDAAFSAGQASVMLNPNANGDVFGQEIQTLQLRTVGVVSIDDVEVQIRQQFIPPQQPPQPVCQSVDRQLNAEIRFDQLNLNGLFDMAQYPGCEIDSVTIVGHSAIGGGQVMAEVNGWQASNWTQFSASMGQYTLDLWSDPETGVNAQQVVLNMLGFITVQSVRLNLVQS